MKKSTAQTLGVILVCIFILSAVIYVLSKAKVTGGGKAKESPDKTARVQIMSQIRDDDESTIWVEITFIDRINDNEQIFKYIDRGITNMNHARNHASIEWSDDSQSVECSINGKVFTIER